MPYENARCHTCAAELAAEDFEKGQAITLLRRNFCHKCMKAAIEKSREAGGAPDFRTPTPRVTV